MTFFAKVQHASTGCFIKNHIRFIYRGKMTSSLAMSQELVTGVLNARNFFLWCNVSRNGSAGTYCESCKNDDDGVLGISVRRFQSK